MDGRKTYSYAWVGVIDEDDFEVFVVFIVVGHSVEKSVVE